VNKDRRQKIGSLVRVVLFAIVVAALIASAWLIIYEVEYQQIPNWL
jgi:hypothetical protein